MEENIFHRFSAKLLQQSVFPYLKDYLLSGSLKAPISINLDLTSACTNRCDYCIDERVLNLGKALDFDYIKKTIRQFKKNGLKSVIVIGGGEPTLHPQFEKVIGFLKELALQVGIVSNGAKIEKIEKIALLLRKGDWVRFSLDASREDTFQKLHHSKIGTTLSGILAKTKIIHRMNPDLQLGYSFLIVGDDKYAKGVKLISNIKEISSAAKIAKENGFNYLSLKPLITPDDTRKTEISSKNLREIKREIREAKKFESRNFKVIPSVNLLCFYDKNLGKLMQKQPKTCHIQHFRSVINPDGVFACSSWRGFDQLRVSVNKRAAKKFNAQKTCRPVQCIYAPLNCWIESLIKSPKKIKELKPISDFGDYFL